MDVTDSPAVLGKYGRAAGAPKGLRSVMKLGEITRAMEDVDQWRRAYAELDRLESNLVRQLRGRGGSWDSIGWLLGVTGSAVRQRFGDQVEGGGADRDRV